MQVGRAEPKRPSRPDTLRPVLDSFEHFRSSARLYQSVFWSLLSCAPRRFQLCANSVFVSIPWHVSAHNHVLGPVKLTMWFDSQVSVTILLRLNFLLPRGPEPHLPPALTVVTAFSAGFQSPIAGGSLLHSWHVDLFWNNRSSVHWNGFMGGRPVELSGWVRWRRAASRATFRWPIVGISFSARGSEGGGGRRQRTCLRLCGSASQKLSVWMMGFAYTTTKVFFRSDQWNTLYRHVTPTVAMAIHQRKAALCESACYSALRAPIDK